MDGAHARGLGQVCSGFRATVLEQKSTIQPPHVDALFRSPFGTRATRLLLVISHVSHRCSPSSLQSGGHEAKPMSQNETILVVEDEPAIAESVGYALRKAGYVALSATDLRSARQLAHDAALVVLDLMLPDGNGRELLEEMRSRGQTTPIIVLSSRDSEEDRVEALEAGADDYVTKPFSPREIVARVRAVLRRFTGEKVAESQLHIDRLSRRVHLGARELELTRVEFDLLAELATHPGKVFARSELINRVWGDGFAITDRTIDSHIKALRRKMHLPELNDAPIETVRGVGYRLREVNVTLTS
jgi:DNA-binding response OmpR family regulator